MRTLARAITSILIAAVIAICLTVTWTTGVFWIVMACCAAAGIGIFIAKRIEVSREDAQDDRLAQDVAEYHCRGNGHHLEADAHGWHCTHCGYVVRSIFNCGGLHHYEVVGQSQTCTVCGYRSALPYDQDLDGTDLGQWDREVGA